MVSEFYSKLKQLKVNVKLVNGSLDLQAPKGVLNNELIEEIKYYKKDLIDFISSYKKESYSAIPKTITQKNYPVSSSQRRLWIVSQTEEGNIAYNIPGIFVFEGKLNREALACAFATLIGRHENLRTVFKEDEQGELKQFVLANDIGTSNYAYRIQYEDIRHDKEQDRQLNDLVQAATTNAFDLAEGPLLRAGLFQLQDTKWVFAYVMHHIISDGWSMGILMKELLQLYNAHAQGEPIELPALRIQYKDYAIWQQAQLSGESLQYHKNYWLKQFEGPLPVLNLQGDQPRPAVKTYNGGAINKVIDAKLTSALRNISTKQDATLFMSLLAVANTLLYKYTGQEDIIIGSPVAGRQHADLEGQIGLFLNTLAFRARFKADASFNDLLHHVKQVTLEAYNHQVYPFDELINELHLQHDRSRNPLFDISLNLNNTETELSQKQQLVDLMVSTYDGDEPIVSRMDMIFNFVETTDELSLRLEYNKDIFNEARIERLASHFLKLLESISTDPNQLLKNLGYLSNAEKQQLTRSFNDTITPFPKEKTLVALFEDQVKATPALDALIYKDSIINYKSLDEKSNQLAHYLIDKCGVKPNDLVGIMLDRSEKTIIAILGILKAGAVYVPIDADYPTARKEFILKDTSIRLLITQTASIEALPFKGIVFNADEQLHKLDTSRTSPNVVISPDSLAYIIYTSGSTGVPKGVMIQHAAIVNTIFAQQQIFDVKTGEHCLQFASSSFDASVSEIFVALASGAALYIVEEETKKNPALLEQYITDNKIDLATIPPAYLQLLQLEKIRPLKKLVTAGEAAIAETVRAFSEQGIYYNAYGPTETSICATIFKINKGERIETRGVPIGKPIANAQVLILDDQNNLMPLGSVGELCVGGAGLAKGYLNKADLTAEKFIPHPFKAGERLYKTGDLGKWLADGSIEFIGRKDDQVKIRGFRVELGEIETTLQGHPSIDSAIVITQPNKEGEKDLVAYIVSNEKLNTSEIRSYLSASLPDYMLPNHYVQLDELPLNSNGKVDKKKLPEPEGLAMSTGVEYIAARNEIEEKLIVIWEGLLDKKNIGVKDNFFELGGHSLKGTRLVSQIHKEFEVKLELIELFSKPVLEDQAQLIQQAKKITFTIIPPVASNSSYPLSAAQRRLWILSQFEESNVAYNMPGIYSFEGELNTTALTHAFATLLARHESLRTVFHENETGEVRQFIRSIDDCGFTIPFLDLRKEQEREQKIKTLVHAEFTLPFQLTTGPLIRANLFQLEDGKWVFTYVMHHIISDGWSMGVLINELLQSYTAKVKGEENLLKPLRIQYKDYAAWQHERLSGAALNDHKVYWLKQFEGDLPVLELPADKIRPAVKTYNGGVISKQLDTILSAGMKNLSQEQGCTLFMGLLAAVNVLFYKYTGQEDIIIGSPIAGREHADLEDQIGFYVNTLALRTRFSGADSYKKMLKHTKEVTLGAYEHQLFPFDELVDALQLKRNMSRNPLFDVEVILQNNETDKNSLEDLESKLTVNEYDDAENPTSRFDMVFSFVEVEERLHLSIEYNSDIYNRDTAVKMGEHLEQLMGAIIEEPDTEMYKLEMLTAAEKNIQLLEFNTTELRYSKEKTLVALFEDQVKATPAFDALICKDSIIDYKTLDEKSNQLAHYLINNCAVKPNDLVGIMLDRSEKTIIAILGILKSGAAYVPIDVDYPTARKEFIIRDTGINALITQTELLFDVDYFSGFLFAIDIQLDTLDTALVSPNVTISPDNLAYIIYTSGSTGVPKGVMIQHAAIVNTIFAQQQMFDVKTGEHCLQFASSSFDASVSEIFVALASGAALYIVEEETKKNPALLEQYITDNKIDLATIPPAYLQLLQLEKIRPLKKLVTAGEAAIAETVRAFSEQGIYYNAYGPTETSICATIFKINPGEQLEMRTVPIGKPIANAQVLILDERHCLMPLGSVGELCVGGAGLAKGYLNKTDLTAEKFIPHPFKAGERLYKTGDLGKWLADGSIEFLGRKDDQVKIRGFRIELGEIEVALLQYPAIDSAVVMAQSNKEGEKDLVAYIVSKEELNTSEIRSYLSASLPDYMLPNHYVQLDAFPLNSNGKVDKKKLPEPEGLAMATGVEYIAPVTELEQTMVNIWREILGKEKIGLKDGFFELGGDSIKVLRMSAELKKELNLLVPIADIYKYNTIENILEHISENKFQMDRQAKERAEKEAQVKQRINDLKETVLSSGKITDVENIEDIYPMSPIEKGMVFASVLNPDASIYHDQSVFQQTFVDFQLERFERALKLLVDKHPILRTSFNISGFETPVQLVHKQISTAVLYRDVAALTRADQEKVVQEHLDSELKKAFDFSKAPLWRMGIFHFGNNEYVFAWQCHHSVIDGWSDALFITELNNVYLKLAENKDFKPVQLKSSYKDFIIQYETDRNDETIKEFWREELAESSRLDIFTEQDRFQLHPEALEKDYIIKLEKTAADLKTTVKAISLAAFIYLLKLLNYEQQVVMGLVTNSRPDAEDSDKILGCFLNTIPFKTDVDDEATSSEFLQAISAKLLELKKYERLSMLDITALHAKEQKLHNPFFDVMFNYVDFHAFNSLDEVVTQDEDVVNTTPVNVSPNARTNTYMDFTIDRTGGVFNTAFALSKKLKCGFSAEKLSKLYQRILKELIDRPNAKMNELNLLPGSEKKQLLLDFNDTAFSYPNDKTLIDLFEAQVKERGDAIALEFEGKLFSYRELNEKSNQLAAYLYKEYAIKADDRVSLLLPRNEWMIIAMLGVMKSGAAYLPIDPDYPAERIAYMKEDGNCKVCIDEQLLKQFLQQAQMYATDNVGIRVRPADLAYVIYTSGSTGKPKGVMVEHGNVVAFLQNMTHVFAFHSEVIMGCTANYTFDISVLEIIGGLTSGLKLCLLADADPQFILNNISQKKITALQVTPSRLTQLLDSNADNLSILGQLDYLLIGGEALSPIHYKRLKSLRATKVIQVYGPTENTVWSTSLEIGSSKALSIGTPLLNEEIYVVNACNQLQPIGITGEICIGGAGVSRGYLNRTELTAERFIQHPFKEKGRIYKTGDLGRWNEAGMLEFIGRKDDQVKIRGYRIELGEIEDALLQHPHITTAAVISRSNATGEQELVAYLVGKSGLSVAELRAHLSRSLPQYMLPSYFVELEKMPLTTNGKLDRKKLPAPINEQMSTGVEYVKPNTEIEMQLVAVYEDVLKRGPIGIKEGFFELGGDSIKSIQIVMRLKERGYFITIQDILKHPVIEDLAKHVKPSAQTTDRPLINEISAAGTEALKAAVPEVYRGDIEEIFPVSDTQRLLIREYEKDKVGKGIYHLQAAWTVTDETFSLNALEHSLQALQEKHAVLRTVLIQSENGNIIQCVRKTIGKTLQVEDISTLRTDEQQNYIQSKRTEDIKNRFTVNDWQQSLIRFKILILSETAFELMISCHHAIMDGWGFTVFQNELMENYMTLKNGGEIRKAVIPNSFREHVLLSEAVTRSETVAAFWHQELKNRKPQPPIKKMNETGSIQSSSLALSVKKATRIKNTAEENKVSLRAVFLAKSLEALRKKLNAPDLSIDVVFNGRTTELSDPLNTMGLFWNVLPFYLSPEQELEYQAVQDKLNAYESYARFSVLKIKQQLDAIDLVSYEFTDFHNATNWQEKEELIADLPVITGGFSRDHYHYPLNIKIGVNRAGENEMELKIDYDSYYFSDLEIASILEEIALQLENEAVKC